VRSSLGWNVKGYHPTSGRFVTVKSGKGKGVKGKIIQGSVTYMGEFSGNRVVGNSTLSKRRSREF